ncbi:MAG: enoyl-CoA hydratase/isomerase family protein [Lachnospiraceae bacterium]|nr:enoyl-CoA hydratase/isomerase family protein [Lachnospiraceae bacterium]
MSFEELSKELNTLALDRQDDIAIVYLNRPKYLNRITLEMIDEIRKTFEALEKDNSVRGVILTGAGDRAFCAGADVTAFTDMGPLEVRDFAAYGHQYICNYIENYPKPVIAAVNGYALGGGSELAMMCDIRIAGGNAIFAQPEVTLGLMPLYCATKRLQRLVGFGRAKEMILTGRMISAEEALSIGLVTKVCDPEALLKEAVAEMRLILNNSSIAINCCKIAVNRCADLNIEESGEIERDLAAMLFSTEDKAEGLAAFLEKRKPNYTGK